MIVSIHNGHVNIGSKNKMQLNKVLNKVFKSTAGDVAVSQNESRTFKDVFVSNDESVQTTRQWADGRAEETRAFQWDVSLTGRDDRICDIVLEPSENTVKFHINLLYHQIFIISLLVLESETRWRRRLNLWRVDVIDLVSKSNCDRDENEKQEVSPPSLFCETQMMWYILPLLLSHLPTRDVGPILIYLLLWWRLVMKYNISPVFISQDGGKV